MKTNRLMFNLERLSLRLMLYSGLLFSIFFTGSQLPIDNNPFVLVWAFLCSQAIFGVYQIDKLMEIEEKKK